MDRYKDGGLCQPPADKHPILAASARGAETAIVTATLSANLGDRAVASRADHGARKQVGRELTLAASLVRRESPPPFAARPRSLDYLASRLNLIPEILRDDPQRFVLVRDPFGFGLVEAATASRPRVAPAGGAVPRPTAHILLVGENPAHSGGGPASARPYPARNFFGIEVTDNPRQRYAIRERLEDANDNGCLARVNLHSIAFRPWPALLVHADRAHRNRAISERQLAYAEAALFLADLSSECFLLQIPKLQFVEDAADLDPERRFFVLAVEPVGNGHDADAFELELGKQ